MNAYVWIIHDNMNFLLDDSDLSSYDVFVNRLPISRRVAVVAALVEGSSINSIVRMTGVAKHTILKLLEDMGCACAAFMIGRFVRSGQNEFNAMKFGNS